jgi:hypothetical protein
MIAKGENIAHRQTREALAAWLRNLGAKDVKSPADEVGA